jgi:hypothetical protein
MSVHSTGMAKVLTTFPVKDEYLQQETLSVAHTHARLLADGFLKTFCKQMGPKTNKNYPTV